jgi:hypothetical protein
MKISDELEKEWNQLMIGLTKCFIAQKWNVKVDSSMNIIVNEDWSVITHIINGKILRVRVSFKGNECLEVRHLTKRDYTAFIVANFISLNDGTINDLHS